MHADRQERKQEKLHKRKKNRWNLLLITINNGILLAKCLRENYDIISTSREKASSELHGNIRSRLEKFTEMEIKHDGKSKE